MEKKDNKQIYYITAILALLGILYLGVNQYLKIQNVGAALTRSGFIFNGLSVYKSEGVMNNETKLRGKSYTISFDDKNSSKHCKGFLIIQSNQSVITDFACK